MGRGDMIDSGKDAQEFFTQIEDIQYLSSTPIPLEKDLPIYQDNNFRPFAPQSQFDFKLNRVSRHHKRSLADVTTFEKVVTEDENHIPFGSRDVKGIPTENASVKFDPYSPSSLRVQGYVFQTENGIRQIAGISRYLRSKGIETERIYQARKLNEVIFDGKPISVDDWKKYQIEHADELVKNIGDSELLRVLKEKGLEITAENFIEFVKSHDFFILERDTQTSLRIRDIGEIFKKENGNKINPKDVLSDLFRWVNVRESFRTDGNKEAKFDIENNEDIKRYFEEYLPRKMGTQLGRLHKNGFVHNFASDHNWSLVGSIYDADGTDIVDTEKNPEESKQKFSDDYTTTVTCLATIFFGYDQQEDHQSTQVREGYFLNDIYGEDNMVRVFQNAVKNFTLAYAKEKNKT